MSQCRVVELQPDCITPMDTKGTCIESSKCVSIMSVLKNNDHLHNSEVAAYLRKSQCGFEVGSHKVCCDITDIDQGIGNDIEKYYENQLTTIAENPQHLSDTSNKFIKRTLISN